MITIANMLAQIKNAQAVGATEVAVPFSKLKLAIAQLLQAKGFLAAVESKKKKLKKVEVEWLNLKLKYQDGVGAIQGAKLISRSSRRVYAGKSEFFPVKSGYGIAVVSTPKGIMTGTEARQAAVGGEVLFEIWWATSD